LIYHVLGGTKKKKNGPPRSGEMTGGGAKKTSPVGFRTKGPKTRKAGKCLSTKKKKGKEIKDSGDKRRGQGNCERTFLEERQKGGKKKNKKG